MLKEINIQEVLSWIQAPYEVLGQSDVDFLGIAPIHRAQVGDLSFITDKRGLPALESSRASWVIAPESMNLSPENGRVIIATKDPSVAITDICEKLESLIFEPATGGVDTHTSIHESVGIDESASVGAFTSIGEGTQIAASVGIGSNVSIGRNCRIGEGTQIGPQVSLSDNTEIGTNCRLYPGVVIGAPGFGYQFVAEKGYHRRIPQIGRVIIGDHVDIGANSAVDRARIGETRIGSGTKIDNLVQVGHNVTIGQHCILCAHVGISGSVTIGNYVVLAGKVGIADHVSIADQVQIGGDSGVMSDLNEVGAKYLGVPAMDYRLATKIWVLQKKLPDLFKRFGELESIVKKGSHG